MTPRPRTSCSISAKPIAPSFWAPASALPISSSAISVQPAAAIFFSATAKKVLRAAVSCPSSASGGRERARAERGRGLLFFSGAKYLLPPHTPCATVLGRQECPQVLILNHLHKL